MATIDILIPTYNGSKYIIDTLNSIFSQSYSDFRIIISDDNSTDNTLQTIKTFKKDKNIDNSKLKLVSNNQNSGYPQNLERLRHLATAKYIFLCGQDDILSQTALEETINAFKVNPKIGAVTRPYFWFDQDISTPVRTKKYLHKNHNTVVKITDSPKNVIRVFETLDQLSGLAYRNNLMTPFHPDIFPCHIYPFAQIFKNHPITFLKNHTVAVRIASSQTRSLSSIYNKSPLLSWVEMVKNIFPKSQYSSIQKYLIRDFITKNYVGLVQIRNYAKFKYLLREIWYLLKFNWQNIFSIPFWFFSLGCLIVPPKVLIPMVDWYKNRVYSKAIKKIQFTSYLEN